jgi:type IV pilus assembly protein PilB
MGIDPYNIASTISLIVSQRLLRKLDPATRERDEVTKDRLLAIGFREDELAGLQLYRAKTGESSPTGYKGRIGIFQVFPVTKTLERLIIEGANDSDVEAYAEAAGIADLRRSALEKLKTGLTDIDEVERVLGLVEQDSSDRLQISQILQRPNTAIEPVAEEALS